ncbi:MAG: hypothetical protein ACR2QV_05490 [Gammaproteobacteria bacterium]
MKEDNVFWVGTQPLAEKNQPALADNEEFVAAISGACAAAGCRAGQFVSALGPYGTWVVEVERDRAQRAQRIVWNGKEARLILQSELPEGGWEDPRIIEVTAPDTAGFVAGVTELLK